MLYPDQMPILRPIPVTKRGERRRFELMEDWKCELLGRGFTFIIPKGFVFDGASIPRLFWNMLSPSGYLFLAGLLHDFIYKYRFVYVYSVIDSLDGGEPRIIKDWFNQAEADHRFEVLADKICMGAHFFTKTAYISLRGFGWITWEKYRKVDCLCLLEPHGFQSFRKKDVAA